jgi:hypothetical protein
MVIGQIEEVHVTDSCLTDGKPDLTKIKPFLWAMGQKDQYMEFGRSIGMSHSIGKQIKTSENKSKVVKTRRGKKADQILEHDGTLGFIDALKQKAKGKSLDVRLDI